MARTKPKPRPIAKDNPHTSPTTMRFDPALLAALDEWTARINAKSTGPRWERVDVIRAALRRAVEERGMKGLDP